MTESATDLEPTCARCGAAMPADDGAPCRACGTLRELPTNARVAPIPPVTPGGDAGPITDGRGDDLRMKAGDTILGHYTVVRQLGRGGMGAVYLARDEVSGQEVAVKVLPAQLARERDIRERFTLEARALASMDHPNIVPLVTFSQEGEDRFLVMKFIPGEALDARIRRLGVLPPEHARKVMRAVLSALGYAHARGVVHRDVKPSNVLIEGDLDGDHRVFLVDFGIAKKESHDGEKLTQTGMLMGTPQYMSPEQIGGHGVDGRSDLYAAGLVLFEMLAGQPPFDGQKTFQVLRAHVEQPVPDLVEARGAPLPDDLVAITYLLLKKKPKDRPADAAAVIALLDGTGPLRSRTTPSTASLAPRARAEAAGLDDANDDEIAALGPRRSVRAFSWLLLLGVAVVAVAALTLPWPFGGGDEEGAEDEARSTDVEEDVALSMLLSTARLQMEKNDFDRARIAVEAALERDPGNSKAMSLRVDALIGAGLVDDADKALGELKKLLAEHPETDEQLRKHVDEQELALTERRAADEQARREREKERERRERNRRPSELSNKVFTEVTSSNKAVVSVCYVEHVQRRNPRAAGEVMMTVRVQPSGVVDSVELKRPPKAFRNPDFQRCLTNAVKKWRFRPFPGEADSFVHKFVFSPAG